MVGKDHRSPLVAVAEDLGFYTVQAQLDSGVYIIGAVGQDGTDIFFYHCFNGQRGDIAGAADSNRHTPDASTVSIKALID